MNSITEKILKMAENYRDYTSRNLSKLVQIPSTSGNEKQVILELKKMMEEVGFEEVKIDGLGNIIGCIGNGKKVLAIDAHIDTVDVGNLKNWDFDPFSGEIKEGFVLGRGSVDQKGGAAAFITAGKILKELGVNSKIKIYFVGSVMEEDCEGLCWKYIIEEDKINPDIVISTEPTALNIYFE
jgi:putative selenium metabolism hydrolase